jgi:L-ascorbate metabolism protein UlaG (beta-lactamase superfamily)
MTGRRRARVGWLALGLAGASAWAAFELGWLSPPRGWAEATGWQSIPDPLLPPATPLWQEPDGEAPDLRWLGHSGFALSWRGTRLLLDPNTSARCAVAPRVMERAIPAARIFGVDAVLLSHAHFDHLDLRTLQALPAPRTIVVPAGGERLVASLARGGVSIVGIRPGQQIEVGDLSVVAVPADHNGGRLHPLRSGRPAVGYVIRGGGSAIYYAGDTGAGAPFERIAREHAPRAAVLPIGAYSPAWPIGLYHLSPAQAAAAARTLGVEVTVPSHFGTFRLSLDQPAAALPRFAVAARRLEVRWRMPRLWTERGEVVEPGRGERTVAWVP